MQSQPENATTKPDAPSLILLDDWKKKQGESPAQDVTAKAEPAPTAAEGPETPPPSSFIFTATNYLDDQNRHVEIREIVYGAAPEGFAPILGHGVAFVEVPPGTPLIKPEIKHIEIGVRAFPITMPADLVVTGPDDYIRQVFAAYDAAYLAAAQKAVDDFWKEHAQRVQQAMQQQRRIVPVHGSLPPHTYRHQFKARNRVSR